MAHRGRSASRVAAALATAAAVILLLFAGARAGSEKDPGGVPETIELGDVSFPHQFHFDALGVACRDCHHETQAGKLEIPHPEYFEDLWIDCKTCHHESRPTTAPQLCSSCHHDTPFDIADETLSSKVVVHRSCWKCHDVGKGKEASTSCRTCHARKMAARG